MTLDRVWRSALWLAFAALLAPGCGALPPDAPLPQNVSLIDIGNPLCPDPEAPGGVREVPGVVPVNATCQLTAEVLDEWGIPILQPAMVWRSSDTNILSASGGSRTATLRGRITGSAIVTASDPLGHVTSEVRIQVVAQR